jgi:cupin 2 domain-containing protein
MAQPLIHNGSNDMPRFNLFKPERISAEAEAFENLLQCRNVTIERIQSPAGTQTEMFSQEQDEWVCLLQGQAQLEMAGESIRLAAGEVLFIPAGTPHRVLSTSDRPTCIWLAVHIH